ncbi:hypothetical protein [Chelativorans sp. Marseille-P2723]|uniref:hypothetical protein n=1 Tax=Chelativorans sp. Marseille-P2723 TaxID=2709133 RepID=UPI001FEE245B|nr:hypothetical protein [Chelativorans sp. Marseille-P2723]
MIYRKIRFYQAVKPRCYRWIETASSTACLRPLPGNPALEWLMIAVTLVHAEAPERGERAELKAACAAARHQAPCRCKRSRPAVRFSIDPAKERHSTCLPPYRRRVGATERATPSTSTIGGEPRHPAAV